ncbi:MAG: hypothetical protein GKS00_12350 [Alphaproteobacteria bacterium]|nr:hypothetical protein [Alphaproteobacteria bacterium]
MAASYRLLPKAEADYFDIYAYTYENFGEHQAEKYTGGLLDAFTLITEHTRIGRDIGHIRPGYFRYDYESHTIFYKQDRDGIAIVRILGERQDPLRHL